MIRSIIVLFAVAGISSSGTALAAVNVEISPNNPDLAGLVQLPSPYLGWVAYYPGTEQNPSVWGNDIGNGWGGNPNVIPGDMIRTVAHGSLAGTQILEDQFFAGLVGATTATLNATFRVRYTNNTVGMGTPILSLQLADGPGISLNVGDKDYPNPADRYWYQLVQYKQNSARRLLYAIAPVDPAGGTAQEDPNWHTAAIVVDANVDMVQLWWDGVKVWDNDGQPVTGFSMPNDPNDPPDLGIGTSMASWGCDTNIQPLPAQGGSGAEQKIFWKEIRLQDKGICGTPFADADGDADVDQSDFAVLQQCYALDPMPSVVQGYLCACFDRAPNQDQIVDASDLAAFENCATGPGVPWTPTADCP